MGMPGLSGFIAEFPIFMGVWNGNSLNLSGTALNLNPANYYNWIAIISALGIIITAAYILRAVQKVFFGDYDADKWHDMRPILTIDKLAIFMFCAILIIIGVFPGVIAPVVESGMIPIVNRLQAAQQAGNFIDTMQTTAFNLVTLLGGA